MEPSWTSMSLSPGAELAQRDFNETFYQSANVNSSLFASYLLGQIKQPIQSAPKLDNILVAAAPCDVEEEDQLSSMAELSNHDQQNSTAGCRTRICGRHQRMMQSQTANEIQHQIDGLTILEQTSVNQVWSQFAAAPGPLRQLMLRGLLSICCPSQLSFLSEQIKAECRCDPLELFPREISLKIMGFLDATTLCRAAQVSKLWRSMADNDILWRNMCAQHIERKCEKCGWGLPLMERRRRRRAGMPAISLAGTITAPSSQPRASTILSPLPPTASPPGAPAPTPGPSTAIYSDQQRMASVQQMQAMHALRQQGLGQMPIRPRPPRAIAQRPLPPNPVISPTQLAQERPAAVLQMSSERPNKRIRRMRSDDQIECDSVSSSEESSRAVSPSTRPWKSIYSERLIIERNWRKGSCSVQVFTGHSDAVTCIQVEENMPVPSFPIAMSGSWDRTVRIWNLETGEVMGVLRGHQRGIRSLQFDANKLITGSMDATLKIWNWRTGECLRTLTGHTDAVLCVCAERNLVASGAADSTVRVWDFDAGTVHVLRGHREWVNRVVIWSAEDHCRSTSSGPTPILCRFTRSEPLAEPPVRLLFSASDDGTIKVWDLQTMNCVRTLESHVAQVQALQVLTIDSSLQVRSPIAQDQEARSPGASTSQPTPTANANPLVPLGLGKIRPMVFSGSLDNTLKIWDVETGRCEQTLFGHVQGVWDLAVDKLRISSASHDRTIKIWDTESGRCLHTLVGHRGAVVSLHTTDDRILSGSDDGDIRVWNFSSLSAE